MLGGQKEFILVVTTTTNRSIIRMYGSDQKISEEYSWRMGAAMNFLGIQLFFRYPPTPRIGFVLVGKRCDVGVASTTSSLTKSNIRTTR